MHSEPQRNIEAARKALFGLWVKESYPELEVVESWVGLETLSVPRETVHNDVSNRSN